MLSKKTKPKKSVLEVFTLGYEGLDQAAFVEFVKKNKIKLVADLRKTPLSRKPGFSKKRLAEGLAAKKIDYVHLPGLGVPALWRKKAKLHLITRKKMFKDYVSKVLPEHQAEILILRENMKKMKTALLCYEAEADDCHRHFVGIELQKYEKN